MKSINKPLKIFAFYLFTFSFVREKKCFPPICTSLSINTLSVNICIFTTRTISLCVYVQRNHNQNWLHNLNTFSKRISLKHCAIGLYLKIYLLNQSVYVCIFRKKKIKTRRISCHFSLSIYFLLVYIDNSITKDFVVCPFRSSYR